jgi:hypothetical protein
MSRGRKLILGLIGLGAIGFMVIQFVPAGNFKAALADPGNPPVKNSIVWDSTETERLVRTACYDCHSNETVYPWYARVAPVSWLIARDVNQGRWAMNFSEDPLDSFNTGDMEWHIYNDMPPRLYLPLHPEARYNDEQKAQLVAGLKATFGESEMQMQMGS